MSQRYFLTAESTYEDLRVRLDAQLGYPKATSLSVLTPAMLAPRDSLQRVVLAVDSDLQPYDAVIAGIQPLLDSGAAQELTEQQYLEALACTPASTGGGTYVLPVASASTLGGIKVGANLSISAGVLSAEAGGGGGDYLPLAGGTMTGNIVFDATGGQYIGKGLVDTSRGGSYGISLVCSVGYQWNWQAGWVLATEQNGTTPRPLYLDSAAGTTLRVWDAAENEGVEVAHDGITLPSGVAIEPIADGLRFNVGGSYLSYEANDYLACRASGGGINAIVCLSPIEFQPTPGVATPMKVDPDGLRFPDGTTQTTAPPALADVATSGDYDDLTNTPTLGSAAAAATSDFAASSHTHPVSDLTQSGASAGQAITWSGTAWEPATVSGGGSTTDASQLTSGVLSDARLSFVPFHPFLLMGG